MMRWPDALPVLRWGRSDEWNHRTFARLCAQAVEREREKQMSADEALTPHAEFDKLSKAIKEAQDECSRTYDQWNAACTKLRYLEAKMRPIWRKMMEGRNE